MKNGEMVAAFEREFAAYVGARYAIALNSGTSTLHTALVALGVKPGDKVAVPPLTMSATTIAVLHAGAVPVFRDVDPRTWLMDIGGHGIDCVASIPVSLYGLHVPSWAGLAGVVDDAAQTLRKHGDADFTSYSFQASKILALGEGGMLVTDDEELATKAREFSSLGYRLAPDQPRIDPKTLKHPDFARHHSLGWNYRMSDLVAQHGLAILDGGWIDGWHYEKPDALIAHRREAASYYRDAIPNVNDLSIKKEHYCEWLRPQAVPEGFSHDYWCYAVACDTPERALKLLDAVERHGGERPYPAWRLTYQEPPFRHLIARERGYVEAREFGRAERHIYYTEPPLSCPVAESLQPRLVQFQTNNLASAERNAQALRKAIEEMS